MRGLVMGVLLGVAACGGGVGPSGKLVGAGCTVSGQCESMCLTGDSHFPNGICTLTCRSDGDCPHGARCVSESGSPFCLIACQVPADCAAWGTGFTCDSRDLVDGSGKALVCRVP